jgi:hypothetical protein
MLKVSEAMPALIEEARKDACDDAAENLGTPLERAADATVDFWLIRRDDFDQAVAAGIKTYLSHDAVRALVAETMVHEMCNHLTPDSEADALLQAIGARKP